MLQRDGGPRAAFAARPGVGLTSLEALAVRAAPGEAGHDPEDRTVPGEWVGHVVEPGDHLTYAWFPESGLADLTAVGSGDVPPPESDTGGIYAATAFALDIDFADGGTLGDEPPLDQYGVPVTAAAQAAARQLAVDQWNLRVVDLSVHLGRQIRRVRAVLLPAPDHAVSGFLDVVAVAPAAPPPGTPLDAADTTRGTHSSGRFSRGNTAPLVSLPHGGLAGVPMTDASSPRWPYRYHEDNRPADNRPALQALATSHIPSPWVADRGVFQVMPSPLHEPDPDRVARALGFDRRDETARPHRYRVRLDGGVDVDMTAGEHAVVLRMRFTGGEGSLVLDHHGVVRDTEVRVAGGTAVVTALVDDREGVPPHHVHLRVDHVVADRIRLVEASEGKRLTGHLVLDPGAGGASGGAVEAAIGMSTIGPEEAQAHAEAAGGFDEALRRAEVAWADALGVLEVEGASTDQLRSLYGGLARLLLYPGTHDEPDGRGGRRYRNPFPGESDVRTGRFSMNHGFWDTYRTCWPALALLEPRRAGELGEGFVEHARAGGWTSRWSAPGPLDTMTGTSTDTVFADLALRDVPAFDDAAAYRSALQNATVPADDERVGRKGIAEARFRGWVSTDVEEGLSWTLDDAINDWGAAQLADRLARTTVDPAERQRLGTESAYLARRSLSYRHVFHRGLGVFLGRHADGSWRMPQSAYDPDVWGADYTETNGWGTAFTAPHDGAGLAVLHGGPEGLGRALDAFFARPETGAPAVAGSYGRVIHEMTEARDTRMGMLALSNQPAHHIPFMYLFAGRPDDTHRIVVEARRRLFAGSDLGQGYPGDEDNGEMSAWYLFAAIGLYPLVPATATYVAVPPMLPRVVLRPRGGQPVEIVTRGAGASFVREVRIDGQRWDQVAIPHERVVAARRIEFDLADEPTGWAAGTVPPSASTLRDLDGPLRDLAARVRGRRSGGQGLVDDAGADVVELAAGDSVEIELAESARPGMYTITADEPCTASWSVEWLGEDGAVLHEDVRADEPFGWPRQIRPFTPREAPAADARSTAVRVVARTALRLRQLEFFAGRRSRSRA